MEIGKGVEALKNLPIRDVLRPKDETIAVLTERTHRNAKQNLEFIANTFEEQLPDELVTIGKLRTMAENTADFFPPGGLSVEVRDYEAIASGNLGTTFRSFLENFIGNYVPGFFDQKGNSRNPGVMTIGFLLDFMKMVKPDIASEADVVQSIIDVMREKHVKFSPTLLGASVDDALHMASSGDFPFDFLTSIPDTENFDELYLRFANEKEIDEYNAGKSMQIVVLIRERVSKFSNN